MVDVADRERLQDAKNELQCLLNDETLEAAKTPLLVLGNKVDAAGAMGEAERLYALGLFELRTGKGPEDAQWKRCQDKRPVEVFMCSLAKKFGYGDGFRWVANFLRRV